MARLIQGFTCELQHFNEGDLSLTAHIQFMIGNYRFYKILEKDCYFLDRGGKILVCGDLETVNAILEGEYQLFTYDIPNAYIENARNGGKW